MPVESGPVVIFLAVSLCHQKSLAAVVPELELSPSAAGFVALCDLQSQAFHQVSKSHHEQLGSNCSTALTESSDVPKERFEDPILSVTLEVSIYGTKGNRAVQ
ncbi:hypothetical protein AcW1_001308 [Taiwanofungus camphoratus]|nr:hypothetical protein AcW2_000165 [Antrodia cinnamomea]KAI0937287.1 hypothetical protein AcV5_005230 [Antrodia cinnamomea]KAI0962496.1 hypothetical protein AcV7_001331 [Antrodia cinnamomea]KAI0964499.1 hypothetical protein AcW1_001308 [Antrodia cinnamomea]